MTRSGNPNHSSNLARCFLIQLPGIKGPVNEDAFHKYKLFMTWSELMVPSQFQLVGKTSAIFQKKNIDMLYIFGFTWSLTFPKYVTLNDIFFLFLELEPKNL